MRLTIKQWSGGSNARVFKLDLITVALLVLFGAITLIDTLLLVGCFGIIKDQSRKMSVIMANYKSDLEMTLLNAHNFDSFIKEVNDRMEKEGDTPLPTAYK
jgi:hypothetical protein